MSNISMEDLQASLERIVELGRRAERFQGGSPTTDSVVVVFENTAATLLEEVEELRGRLRNHTQLSIAAAESEESTAETERRLYEEAARSAGLEEENNRLQAEVRSLVDQVDRLQSQLRIELSAKPQVPHERVTSLEAKLEEVAKERDEVAKDRDELRRLLDEATHQSRQEGPVLEERTARKRKSVELPALSDLSMTQASPSTHPSGRSTLSPIAATFEPSPQARIFNMLQLPNTLLQDAELAQEFEMQFKDPLNKKPQEFERLAKAFDRNVGQEWCLIAFVRAKSAKVPGGRTGKCEICTTKGRAVTNWLCSYLTKVQLQDGEHVNAAGKRWEVHLRAE